MANNNIYTITIRIGVEPHPGLDVRVFPHADKTWIGVYHDRRTTAFLALVGKNVPNVRGLRVRLEHGGGGSRPSGNGGGNRRRRQGCVYNTVYQGGAWVLDPNAQRQIQAVERRRRQYDQAVRQLRGLEQAVRQAQDWTQYKKNLYDAIHPSRKNQPAGISALQAWQNAQAAEVRAIQNRDRAQQIIYRGRP